MRRRFMEHTGHVKINRKDIPYHLKDDKVALIPHNINRGITFWPSPIEERDMLRGITTGNREVIFLKCRYNNNWLAYQAIVVSDSNTGFLKDITSFDRICFEGKPVNVFVGPGRAYVSEDGDDISKRMKSITPKNWEDLNVSTNIKIRNREMKLSINYIVSHNKKYADPSMGEAIPQFCIEYSKSMSVKKIPQIYLMMYDFFSFLNFRRNIVFDNILLQREIEGRYMTIAKVFVNSQDLGEFTNTERNSIIIDDCHEYFGDLFKCVVQRRQQKIYDNFYIPQNGKESTQVTYEKYLSCALSFESEYSRLYPSKKEENEKYAYIYDMFQASADKMNILFSLAAEGNISREEFERCFYGDVNSKIKKLFSNTSKSKVKPYQGYYNKIVDALSKIDYSLGEKYKNALCIHKSIVKPVIDKMSSANNVVFPNEDEAGKMFAEFRNGIAHGNPQDIEQIHCVLFEVARALIYIMILKNAGLKDEDVKNIVKKMF